MLTERQKRFVDEYLIDGNGAAAAVRAGYSPRSAKMQASRLMTNDDVVRALEARRHELADQFKLQREDVLDGLLAAIEEAKEQNNPVAMIGGWREVAKLLGFYAPGRRRVELSTQGQDLMKRIEGMSDKELLSIVAATECGVTDLTLSG